MKGSILFLWLLGIAFCGFSQNPKMPFNVDSLISLMSLEEKVNFISGYKNFNIKGLGRLGIPQIKMADGPMGIKGHGKATAFPASICMAASWNPDLIKDMAEAIAIEAKAKGIGILLAPGVNMYRVPHCGRNFEYYGEDPFLASRIAVSFIKGVQSENVMATVKHFVANNQDYDRHRVSSNIDERTLNEIYYPVFKAAVQEAKVGAVMTSYNLLNGIHTSESSYLIQDVLRKKWGFNGIVMSDWISVYSMNVFVAGLDLEMPRPQFMNLNNVSAMIDEDASNEDLLNEKLNRILQTCNKVGLYDSLVLNDTVNWYKHAKLAKQVAREGFVLLKNDEAILPIKSKKVKRILVLGPNAKYTPYSGGGAAMIDAYKQISFLEGIRNNAPEDCQVDYLSTEGMYHQYSFVNHAKFCEELMVSKTYDAVVLCLGFNSKTEGEAFDRPFSLPEEQEMLLYEIAKQQKNTVVVLNAGGAVCMPWVDKVKALLYTWYPGQEGGAALGEIIFGKINPSGKLPISIEKQWKDNAAFNNYDTIHAVAGAKPFYTLHGKEHPVDQLNYEEGIFIGYRHYEIKNISPLFSFGFGLSYTSFELSDLKMDKKTMEERGSIRIQLKVKNIGERDGFETVQLYIHDQESSEIRPIKELKAFQKVYLKAGEIANVDFIINEPMLTFYDIDSHNWIAENGKFDILVGNSSNNIQLRETIQYKRL